MNDGSKPRFRKAANARREVDPTGTPLLYTLLSPFSRGNYGRDYLVFQAFSLICLVGGICCICRALGFGLASAFIAIAMMTDFSVAARSEANVGNVNGIQCGMIGLFLLLRSAPGWRGRDFASGILLACIILFKPNFVLAAPLLLFFALINQRYGKAGSTTIGMLCGGILCIGISSAYFGRIECWEDWLAVRSRLLQSIFPVESGNFALSRLLFEKWGKSYPALLTIGLLALVLIAAYIGRRKRLGYANSTTQLDSRRAFFEDYQAVCFAIAASLVAAPLVWLHYHLLLTPAILHLLRARDDCMRESRPMSMVRFALGGLAVLLLSTFIIPSPENQSGPSLWAFRCISGAIIILLLLLAEIYQMHNFQPESTSSASPKQKQEA